MEEAAGTQLGKMWSAMDLEAKLAVGREVVAVEEKLLSLSFTKYVPSSNQSQSHMAPNVNDLGTATSSFSMMCFQVAVQPKSSVKSLML